ncbi:MAG: hypothetical protein ACOX1O_08035 [Eggerthellaceae bacterium]|jgi:hypothetical protein
MLESNSERNDRPDSPGDAGIGYATYLNLARHCNQSGRKSEALMLYLTAYETASGEEGSPLSDAHPAVDGLRQAWDIACDLEDRTMAEAVHHRLAPHLTPTESRSCTERLQEFALRKLKQMGIDVNESVEGVEFESGTVQDSLDRTLDAHSTEPSTAPVLPDFPEHDEEEYQALTYKDLVGFETAVMEMKRRGFGLQHDEGFKEFVNRLNRHHGIDGLPSFETLLFRAPAREDASRLMFATAGELGQPSIRIRMDTNDQGSSVLCVMASPEVRNKIGFFFSDSNIHGTLILEDVDLWGLPMEDYDEGDGFSYPRLSRGAQKAIALIRASIQNPNITVMASASSDCRLEDYMVDMLAPVTPIEIEMPTYAERTRLWTAIVRDHESLARLDVVKLVLLSAHLSRFDIALCAREAIEQAYRESIAKREYVRVSEDNIYEKLASCQPLDSREYRMLEDEIVKSFAHDLDRLDTYESKEGRR